MSDPIRPTSGIQPTLLGSRMMSPVTHTGVTPVTISAIPNPYGMISQQSHHYAPNFSYTQQSTALNRMPIVRAAMPPAMPGMYVPIAQVPGQVPQVFAAQMPGIQMPLGTIPSNVDPAKLLEQQKKFEKERNFQLQQQRLKQFTISGKKGSINADNLIDSMFGKSQTKEHSQPKISSPLKSTAAEILNENKKPTTLVSNEIQSISPIQNQTPPNTSVIQAKKDVKELDVMMQECFDLKGPQKANTFCKPVIKDLTPLPQQRSTFTSSNKARDWKDVSGLDKVFVQERPRFPKWCCKAMVPEIYSKIEAIVTENGSHPPETNLLFPILVSSGLPQQSLAHIWELVNQSAPGYLTTEEMYASLALIAVSQTGQVVQMTDILHQLPACPVPRLQFFMSPPEAVNVEKGIDQSSQASSNATIPCDSDLKDFPDSSAQHALRPNAISLKKEHSANFNNLNTKEISSSQPPVSTPGLINSPEDEFDDFKSATPTCRNFFMNQSSSLDAQDDDEFDDFKQAPIVNIATKENAEISKSSVVDQDLMSPEEDKYNVFRVLQHTEEPNDWGDFKADFSTFTDSTVISSNVNDEISEVTIMKNQPSSFILENAEKIDSIVTNVSAKTIEATDDDEFGDFLHAEVTQVPISSVANQFQNLGTEFANFANFKEDPQPIPTLNIVENTQLADDFGEFASSIPVSCKVELGQEFLFRHLKDNISLAESQSVSSLELGTFDGGGHSGESKSSLSRQGSIPSLDLKSTFVEAVEGEDGFGELQSASFNQSTNTPSPAKDAKETDHVNSSTVSVGLTFQTARTIPLTDKYSVIRSEVRKEEDQHISNWTHCLQSSVKILQNTKKIFNQMSCSSVCNEVISSKEGENYIKDLIEVYKVVCRISLSSKTFNKQTIIILDLIKEAEQAWNTISGFLAGSHLMPKESSFHFSSAVLSVDDNCNVKACGLCLLNTEVENFVNMEENLKLSYGGRNYHSTCANFWVNCVDPLLPALSVPQLL